MEFDLDMYAVKIFFVMLLPTASFQQRKRMHPLLSTYNLNVENNMQLHKVLILFTVISMG